MKRRNSRSGAMLWSVLGSWGAATCSFAQSTTQPSGLDAGLELVPRHQEVLVTANRERQSVFETPYTAHVISLKRMDEQQPRTLPEALADIPGVMVQKTGYGQGSPFIRGFTGFRTLMLVDGIRLNNSTFREGPNQYWSTIDPFSLERIEIVKGPSSVLYGSDAIGGTVQAITKSPYGWGDGNQVGGEVYTRFGSADHSIMVHPEFSFTHDQKLGILVMGTFADFNDLRGGHDIGLQENTGYQQWSGDLKAEYRLDEQRKFVLGYQQMQQNNVPRTHSTIYAESFAGSAVGTDLRRDLDQDRQLAYVQFHAQNVEPWIESMIFSVSWQGQDESEDRIRGNSVRSVTGTDVDTFGLWAQITTPTPIGRFTYGFEYYYDMVSSYSSDNDIQGPVADDANYHLAGLFIQDTIDFTDRLQVVLGGRVTYARAEADSFLDTATDTQASLDETWCAFVGSARASYQIVPDHWNVFAGVSQGFRAPNLSDLTRLDIARSGELETPAPGLDPEYFTTYETGIKADYQDFSFQASYFFTDITDMIVRVPTGAIVDGATEVTKLNAGDGYVHGVEVGTSWRFHPQWTTFGGFTWQFGDVDGYPTSAAVKEREPLSRVMPTTAILGLRFDPTRNVWIEGTATIAHQQDRLSSGDERDTQRIPPGGTPEYETFSIRGGYRVNENITLTMGVENIFNEDYRIHGSGVNAPGTNFVLGLRVAY